MKGLYVHIPFCKSKCESRFDDYLDALRLEMLQYRGHRVGTVFIGGGTPSLLQPRQLRTLLIDIRENFNCRSVVEFSIESNPESLTDEKLHIMRSNGVNRLSIGLQSMNDRNLRFLGRVHSVFDSCTAMAGARRLGFSNINIDMIYGLPGQTILEWQLELQQALRFNPEHISIYPLTIEDGTVFALAGVKVDNDAQAEIYEWTMDFMQAHGYEQYEISNWSKTGYRCRHNLIYWSNKEYIGIGAGAASYFTGVRRTNTGIVDGYISAITLGKDASNEREVIGESTFAAEEMILKLRTADGVMLRHDIKRRYGAVIKSLTDRKLLSCGGSVLRLTRQGKLLANQVMKEFV
jgi:oxygen-independent coproporphyrinogen-3 oxidase